MHMGRALVLVAVVAPLSWTVGCSDDEESTSQCEEFLEFTASCYQSVGVPVQVNAAACDDSAYMTPLVQAQITCGSKYRDTWCDVIRSSAGADAGAGIDPRDPDLLQLNACMAELITKPPCKEAIRVLADCGTYLGFVPECIESAPAIAQCIVDHPESACAALGGTGAEAGAEVQQEYYDCVWAAQAADAGAD